MPGFTSIPGKPRGAPASGNDAAVQVRGKAGVSPRRLPSGRIPGGPKMPDAGMPIPMLSAARSGRGYLGIPGHVLAQMLLPLEREFLRRMQMEEGKQQGDEEPWNRMPRETLEDFGIKSPTGGWTPYVPPNLPPAPQLPPPPNVPPNASAPPVPSPVPVAVQPPGPKSKTPTVPD